MTVIYKAPQHVIGCLDKVKSDSSALDKGTKAFRNGVQAITTGIGRTCEPMTNLTKTFEVFNGLFSGLHLVSRTAEWLAPGKNGDLAWKSWKKVVSDKNAFQDDGYWNWQGTASKVPLTAAHALGFTSFLHKLGFINLGAAAGPIGLATNLLYIPASSFGIADGFKKISNQNQYVANGAAKVDKWVTRSGLVGAASTQPTVQELHAKYSVKIDEAEAKLDPKNKDALSKKERTNLEEKVKVWEQYCTELEDHDPNDTLAELPADSLLKSVSEWKVRAWNKNLDAIKKNSGKEKTKSWLQIIENIGKLVLGILALIGIALGIALNPAFAITLAAGWFATNTIGLTKIMYGKYNQTEKIRKPHTLDLIASPPDAKGAGEEEEKKVKARKLAEEAVTVSENVGQGSLITR